MDSSASNHHELFPALPQLQQQGLQPQPQQQQPDEDLNIPSDSAAAVVADTATTATTATTDAPVPPVTPKRPANKPLDLASDDAFPGLGSPSPGPARAPATPAARPAWGSSPAIVAKAASSLSVSDSLVLPTNSIYVPPSRSYANRSSSRAPTSSTSSSSLGEIMNQIMKSNPSVKIDASTANDITTFLIRGKSSNVVAKAKSELAQKIERKVDMSVPVPASTRPFIVGQRGKNLKAIQDQTGVNIQIPQRRNDEPEQQQQQQQQELDPENDPEISVIVSGPISSAQRARDLILDIVRQRTSKLTRRLTGNDVPYEYWPLLRLRVADILEAARKSVGGSINKNHTNNNNNEEEAQESPLDINIPAGPKSFLENANNEPTIFMTGDRDLVTTAEEVLRDQLDVLKRTTRTAQLSLPKRQHRFLVGANADDILQNFGCTVELPPIDDPSDAVVVRGNSTQLGPALSAVMEKAASANVDVLDLASIHHTKVNDPAALEYAKDVNRYILRRQRLRQIAERNGVEISAPRNINTSTAVELVGKDVNAVQAARAELLSTVKSIPPSYLHRVHIDPLLHRHLIGKNGQRIRTFEEKNSVNIIFPTESEAASDDPSQTYILLVFAKDLGSSTISNSSTNSSAITTPSNSSAPSPTLSSEKNTTKQQQQQQQSENGALVLEQVKQQLEKLASEAADMKVSTFSIPSNLHPYFLGPNRTTLNAIIGEQKAVVVRAGNPNDKSVSPDQVTVRGPSQEVERVEAEIKRLAQEGKVNECVAELTVDSRFVGHLVGKGGSGASKLKEELDVRVEFGDPVVLNPDPSVKKSKSKPSSGPTSVSLVTFRGRKENVEEAKKRLEGQAQRLADEATLTVPIPAGIDRGSLIGKQGAYVQRLETKYNVRINFPSSNNNADISDTQSDISASASPSISSSAQEIRIRGPKKGAEAAKREFVDLIAYEKENRNEITMNVPEKAMARLFGRSGNQLREITDETGANIDVSKPNESSDDDRKVVIRGTKSAISDAQKLIDGIITLAINERVVNLHIDPSLHVTLIGRGGQNIANLIERCGGPSDTKSQSGLVRFPRRNDANSNDNHNNNNEEADLVTVRGDSKLVDKIVKEIEKEVATLKDRVVYGVAVPKSAHSALIGRSASGVNEIQREYNVRAIFPNWREHASAGQPVNESELEGADPIELVKLVGPKDACETVAQLFQERAGTAPVSSLKFTQTVPVPASIHHRVLDSGRFLRALPSDVRLSHGDAVIPKKNDRLESTKPKADAASARIDQSPASVSPFLWEISSLQDDSNDSDDIPWRFAASSQESLDNALELLSNSLQQARSKTHRGVLQVPQGLMPRIVGRAGIGLDKIRQDYDCDVEVLGKRNSDTLSLVGSPEQLEKAKNYIQGLNRR